MAQKEFSILQEAGGLNFNTCPGEDGVSIVAQRYRHNDEVSNESAVNVTEQRSVCCYSLVRVVDVDLPIKRVMGEGVEVVIHPIMKILAVKTFGQRPSPLHSHRIGHIDPQTFSYRLKC